MITQFFRFLLACATLALGGCGGGGGSGIGGGSTTLQVGLAYPTSTINLYSSATVTPNFTGFQGHTPNCALISGGVPTGMTLNSDCSVSGVPTGIGSFYFGIKVGAEGVSNTINSSGTITVQGPAPAYPYHAGYQQGLHIGDTVSDRPNFQGWPTPVGASWKYQLYTGTLPPGLSLDQATGLISGVITTQGSYSAGIQATLTSTYGTYAVPIPSYVVNVGSNTFSYSNTGGTGQTLYYLKAYISQPFAATPMENGPGSLSAFNLAGSSLPVGLNLDPNTGAISGTPTTFAGTSFGIGIPVAATVTSGGISSATSGHFDIQVFDPIGVSYPINMVGKVGSALNFSPVINYVSPIPVAGVNLVYTARPPGITGCSLPPGVMLNNATGVVTGTPGATGTFSCEVDIKITNNAISWNSAVQILIVVN